MHEFNDVIVRDGKVVLSHLPYADGQHVRVVVAEASEPSDKRISIEKVRQLLKGSVERFDDPFEPLILGDSWEMLK